MRLDKLRADPARDAHKSAELSPLLREPSALAGAAPGPGRMRASTEFRWLLEELRVSMFAQELRTPMPVSVKRLQKQLASIAGG